jgi:type II secretory pathway pseudopilin PulG
MLLANMVGIRERAADTRAKNNLNQLKNALRLYYNDNQRYPNGSTSCANLANAPHNLTSTYIDSSIIPGNDGYSCIYTGSGDTFNAYIELQSSAGTEDTDSAERCGLPPVDGEFYVCAN